MATITKFEELEIWQLARTLCREIYILSFTEPLKNDYRLKDQMRGSAGSAMDNIAEGFGRKGKKEFIQFLFIAKGSAIETKSQLYRAKDRCYITENCMRELFELLDQVLKMIYSLVKKLQFKLNN